MMTFTPGARLHRYRLIERIGAGGMGEVFLAHDPHLDRRVALKLLPARLADDLVARERLRREALASAALDHPFICKVYEVGEDADGIFIAMEYLRGQTLHARMEAGHIPLAEALRIAGELAEAIEEAHAANLIHRDLKPANIMLTAQGHVKVMDFGLAKRLPLSGSAETITAGETQLTTDGTIVGTPDYMSPEQLTGTPLDGRSDLFAFGIILCEILIGKHPFRRGSAMETVGAILRDPPALSLSGSGDLSPGLMVLIRRLLAKTPDERYRSMTEVRTDLGTQMVAAVAAEPLQPPVQQIGRDAERDQLLRHLDAALAGRGSLVLIGGEPGIGKTHLARALLAEGTRRGCFGVVGHCSEVAGAPPYVPFIETLEFSARVLPRDLLRHYMGESASEIARLMPELRRIYPDIPPAIELPPEQQRRYLFNAYREFVDRAARLTPIVVVFEDLHWADEASLLLLRHLAQSVSTIPVLMVGTYRDVDLDVNRPFADALESWIREKLATRLTLRRFGLGSVQELLTSLSGKKPPDSLAGIIHVETDGNPFFVEEVYRHLNEEGKLFDETGAWRTGLRSGELEVPQGVRLVIGRRLHRLKEQSRRVLTTAAVAGRSFDLRLLETLEPTQADASLDAIEEAERAHLVEPDRGGREVRYRFVHELVRQVLVEGLSLPRRQRVHERIAGALERLHGERQASAIAHHLYQAGAAADPEKTISYLMRAASLATAGAAHQEAVDNVDRALSLIEGERHSRTGELSLLRAIALRSLSRREEAIEWYDRAIRSFASAGDVAKAAEASLSLAYVHLWNADGLRGRAVLDQAIQIVGAEPSSLLHRILMVRSTCFAVSGAIEEASAALVKAKEVELKLPERPTDGFAAMTEARILYELARIEEADQCAREVIRRFKATGDLWGQAEVFEIPMAAVYMGRIREAGALLREVMPLAERVGHSGALWVYKVCSARVQMALGDFDEALGFALEARALGESNGGGWSFLDGLNVGSVAWVRGDLDHAIRYLRAAWEKETRSFHSGTLSGALFLALAMKGDPGVDAALTNARRDLPVTGGPLSVGRCDCVACVLEGLAVLGRREEIAALETLAEYVVERGPMCVWSQNLLQASAGIAAAAAGHWERAEDHFRTAMPQADSAPYRTAQPVVRLRYADMLLSRGMAGDRERALKFLNEALDMCRTVGMAWYAEHVERRIRVVASFH